MDKTHPCFVAEHEEGEAEAVNDEKEEMPEGEGDEDVSLEREREGRERGEREKEQEGGREWGRGRKTEEKTSIHSLSLSLSSLSLSLSLYLSISKLQIFSLEDIPTHGHVCVHHSSPPGDPNYEKSKILSLIKRFSHSIPHVQLDKEGHVEISKEELDILLKKTALN